MKTTNSFHEHKQVVDQNPLPLPPGHFGFPFIGETISFLQDPDFVRKRKQKYGNIFKTHLLGCPTIVMIGAEANQFLLTNENRYFCSNWPYSTRVLVAGNSLSGATGSKHLQGRKLLSQAFQPRALSGYVSAMADITHSYLRKWEQIGDLTWYPELRKYTFDVASKLLVGVDGGANELVVEWFELYSQGVLAIPVALPWTRFGRALKARQKLLAKVEQIIQKRQQQTELGEDILGILLQAKDEEGNQLSLGELKDQILLLLFAGHDTLTSALSYFCLLLAQNKDVLQTARREQQQLGFKELFTLDNLKQMTYLEQVLKEVLRLQPPASGGFRQVLQSCEFNGYSIPQGWSVLYRIIETHQDTCIYTEPENFDPQRFDPFRSEDKTKSFSHIPFGGGVRECLGKEFARLEMKLFAALLIREYDWELVPQQNQDRVVSPVPHPRSGLQVKFKRLSTDA
ncbi:cytochrome P450 [Calothrix brevissima NIES-22]|nr:cytochrome P450 [Calothrix brevissima NIES-22]